MPEAGRGQADRVNPICWQSCVCACVCLWRQTTALAREPTGRCAHLLMHWFSMVVRQRPPVQSYTTRRNGTSHAREILVARPALCKIEQSRY